MSSSPGTREATYLRLENKFERFERMLFSSIRWGQQAQRGAVGKGCKDYKEKKRGQLSAEVVFVCIV